LPWLGKLWLYWPTPVTATRSTEALADPAADHLLVRRFSLQVAGGPQDGATYASEGRTVVVGTHRSADFILADTTMSRFHCEIGLDGGKPFLRDLGSRNGTLVDGVPVQAAPLRDGAVITLGRTRVRVELGKRNARLALSPRPSFGRLVGRSPAMRAVFAVLERAAPSDATVLLLGETGTGKDVAAESIHQASPRADGPLVVVDCGAIPAQLLESELFGHERGAFTGADRARVGAFEAAHGGTLFLDEVGELSLELQPKFLRALESHTVQRVGSAERRAVDVRVVAATNRNLRAEVNAGRFRADLFYRLAVVEVRLPPLRERSEDLPMLVEALAASIGGGHVDARATFGSAGFQAELARHDGPGNVRELRNYLERALTLPDAGPPEPVSPGRGSSPDGAAPVDVATGEPYRVARQRWLRHFERQYLSRLLAEHGHNVSEAARAAGVGRVHFYRLMAHAGLR
jgi:two-component system, NtrC family, response regulator GlrR